MSDVTADRRMTGCGGDCDGERNEWKVAGQLSNIIGDRGKNDRFE